MRLKNINANRYTDEATVTLEEKFRELIRHLNVIQQTNVNNSIAKRQFSSS